MNKFLRWLGLAAGVLVVILLIAGVAVYAASSRKLNRVYAISPTLLSIPSDSAAVARGGHLAIAITKCVDCHGSDLGGHVMIPDARFALVVAPNITRSPSGIGGTLTDQDMVNAVRHGIKHDGTPILLMPSSDFWRLSDADLSAIVAWVRSRPPVDHVVPVTKAGPISRVLFALNQLPIIAAEQIDHAAKSPAAPAAGPTKEYGEYLANVGGCRSCHGPSLSGGHIPGSPPEWKPAANITPTTTRTWTEADFTRVLREGKTPLGLTLDTLMPYRFTRFMTDDEIHAMWAYLQTVPAKQYAER
ncbi:MAG TPA: c-type cytochrome [Gemmatimonadales bacterium]|jgi:mono/diheme cytochrome c family protein